MAERDKIEPFWARPARARRRSTPQLVVPPREAAPERAPPPQSAPPPEEAPQEPSFAASRQARREAVAALVAAPVPAPVGDLEPSFAGAAPAPDAEGWLELGAEAAARHPLFGIRGWLVLVAILVVLGLLRALVEMVDFWATTDHGGLAAWIMAVLRSGMALWGAVILGLLLARRRAFPTNFAAYGMVNIIYLVLFGLAFAHVTDNRVFAGVAVAIAVNLLAIAYVLRSRRVNITFRHRVRAGHKAEAGAPPAARGETAEPSGA